MNNNIISPIPQAASLSSSLLSLPSSSLRLSSSIINSSSDTLFGGVSRIGLPVSLVASEDSPWKQHSPRWLINPLFPRSVPLFQYLSSFTKETEIARNGLVEGHLINNKDTILPLIGIVALEWSN